MKLSTSLELIVFVFVVAAMIYIVQPESRRQPQHLLASEIAQLAPEAPRSNNGQIPLFNRPPPPTAPEEPGATEIGTGCLVFGGVGLGLAYLVGPAQVATLVTAGAAVPAAGAVAAPAVLSTAATTGVLGSMFAAGCALGAVVVPLIFTGYDTPQEMASEFAVAFDRASAAVTAEPAHPRPAVIRQDAVTRQTLLEPYEQPRLIHIAYRPMPTAD